MTEYLGILDAFTIKKRNRLQRLTKQTPMSNATDCYIQCSGLRFRYILRRICSTANKLSMHFLTSSMRHPNQKLSIASLKRGLMARCFLVKNRVFVK